MEPINYSSEEEARSVAYDLNTHTEEAYVFNVREDAMESGTYFIQMVTTNTTLTPAVMEKLATLNLQIYYVKETEGHPREHVWNVSPVE